MSKEKQIVYTDNDRALVAALKGTDGLTLAELNANGASFKSGHLVSAMKKGLIEKVGEKEVIRPSIRKVSTYCFVSAEPMSNAEGKPFNYTDGEKEILSIASSIDSPFTLADLARAMNREKMSSGSINGLVKKGNFAKGDQVEVESTSKSTVGVYGFVRDIE